MADATAIATPRRRMTGWEKLTIVLLLLAGLAAGAAYMIRFALNSWAPIASSSNLRQIGYSLQLYAKDHAGRLPADWAELIVAMNGELPPEVFLTPFSPADDTHRKWPLAARARLVATAGAFECTYLFTAANADHAALPADAVLAIEQAEAHGGRVSNILLADGSVEALVVTRAADHAEYDRVLLDYASGVRPVRFRPTPAPASAVATAPTSRATVRP